VCGRLTFSHSLSLQGDELVIGRDRDWETAFIFAIEAPALIEVEVQPRDWVAGPIVRAFERGCRCVPGAGQRVKERVDKHQPRSDERPGV
jgi:hypothetical protein